MKQQFQALLLTLSLMIGISSFVAVPVGAINVFKGCSGNEKTAVCKAKDDDVAGELVRDIIGILLFILGVIAVIMIIVGGIKYAVSDGDASKIKSAKDTVLYAVVGLIVAMLAYTIVNYVVDQF